MSSHVFYVYRPWFTCNRSVWTCVILCPAAGLQDRLRLPASHRPGEAKAQERRGDPCHCHSIHVRGGRWQRHTAALQVPAAAAAEGEDALAQFTQQLHQGQRGGWRGALQQPDNHGEHSVSVCVCCDTIRGHNIPKLLTNNQPKHEVTKYISWTELSFSSCTVDAECFVLTGGVSQLGSRSPSIGWTENYIYFGSDALFYLLLRHLAA